MKNLLREFTEEFLAEGPHKVSVEALFQEKEPQVLLDVRSTTEEECMSIAEEISAYPLLRYRHIPMHELPDRLDELDPAEPLVAFCRTTTRSAMVYAFLRLHGFTCVRLLEGGYVALVKKLMEE